MAMSSFKLGWHCGYQDALLDALLKDLAEELSGSGVKPSGGSRPLKSPDKRAGVAAADEPDSPRPLSDNEWKRKRLAAGMTQVEWADALGCEVRTVIRWEREGVEPLPVFKKLMEVLR